MNKIGHLILDNIYMETIQGNHIFFANITLILATQKGELIPSLVLKSSLALF